MKDIAKKIEEYDEMLEKDLIGEPDMDSTSTELDEIIDLLESSILKDLDKLTNIQNEE